MKWKHEVIAITAFVVSLNLIIEVPKALFYLLTGPLP